MNLSGSVCVWVSFYPRNKINDLFLAFAETLVSISWRYSLYLLICEE